MKLIKPSLLFSQLCLKSDVSFVVEKSLWALDKSSGLIVDCSQGSLANQLQGSMKEGAFISRPENRHRE